MASDSPRLYVSKINISHERSILFFFGRGGGGGDGSKRGGLPGRLAFISHRLDLSARVHPPRYQRHRCHRCHRHRRPLTAAAGPRCRAVAGGGGRRCPLLPPSAGVAIYNRVSDSPTIDSSFLIQRVAQPPIFSQ